MQNRFSSAPKHLFILGAGAAAMLAIGSCGFEKQPPRYNTVVGQRHTPVLNPGGATPSGYGETKSDYPYQQEAAPMPRPMASTQAPVMAPAPMAAEPASLPMTVPSGRRVPAGNQPQLANGTVSGVPVEPVAMAPAEEPVPMPAPMAEPAPAPLPAPEPIPVVPVAVEAVPIPETLAPAPEPEIKAKHTSDSWSTSDPVPTSEAMPAEPTVVPVVAVPDKAAKGKHAKHAPTKKKVVKKKSMKKKIVAKRNVKKKPVRKQAARKVVRKKPQPVRKAKPAPKPVAEKPAAEKPMTKKPVTMSEPKAEAPAPAKPAEVPVIADPSSSQPVPSSPSVPDVVPVPPVSTPKLPDSSSNDVPAVDMSTDSVEISPKDPSVAPIMATEKAIDKQAAPAAPTITIDPPRPGSEPAVDNPPAVSMQPLSGKTDAKVSYDKMAASIETPSPVGADGYQPMVNADGDFPTLADVPDKTADFGASSTRTRAEARQFNARAATETAAAPTSAMPAGLPALSSPVSGENATAPMPYSASMHAEDPMLQAAARPADVTPRASMASTVEVEAPSHASAALPNPQLALESQNAPSAAAPASATPLQQAGSYYADDSASPLAPIAGDQQMASASATDVYAAPEISGSVESAETAKQAPQRLGSSRGMQLLPESRYAARRAALPHMPAMHHY